MVSEEKLPERVVLGEVLGFVYGGLSGSEIRTVRTKKAGNCKFRVGSV